MSLFADYVRERERKDVYEDQDGFVTFIIEGPECYITDIYVRPEARKKGHGTLMVNHVAKYAASNGCTYLKGSIDPKTWGATDSMKAHLAYGFELWKVENPLIYLVKRLRDGTSK